MKVCVLITGLGTGGAENHLLKVLPRVSFEVVVISLTNDNSVGTLLEEKGVRVHYLGMNKVNWMFKIARLRHILREEQPDVLDTYLIHANIIGRFMGVKRVINSVRNDYSDYTILNYIDKATQGKVDVYVPNSQALVEYLHEKNNVPLAKIRVLPNGIEFKDIRKSTRYDLRTEHNIARENILLIYHGRLHEQKRLETVIEAMKGLGEKYTFVIIGEGSEETRLKRKAQENDVDVRFIGRIDERKQLYSYLAQANCYILPSRKEGMSNALLEAMSLGVKCVVSNIKQNTELITDGKNGFVFKLDDEQDLREKIREAEKGKIQIGLQAQEKIKKEHDIKEIVKTYERIVRG